GSGFRRRIYRIDIEVLISVVILGKNYVLAVPRPQISGDRSFRLRSKQSCGAKRLIHSLDVNVAGVFPGFQKGDVLAVGGKLGCGNLWVAEDYVTVDQRWRDVRFNSLSCTQGRDQENTHQSE